MYDVYLEQQDHVGFGQLFAVQRAHSQTRDSHVTDSRVSVSYAGQDLTDMEKQGQVVVVVVWFFSFFLQILLCVSTNVC